MPDDPPRHRVSEGEAGRILDLAARLDAERGHELDVGALRASALEAGISSEAFEHALAEIRSRQVAPPGESPATGLSPRLYRGMILGTGIAIGALEILLERGVGVGEGSAAAVTLLLAAVATVRLLLGRRPNRAVSEFEVDFGVLWVAITAVLMMGHLEYAAPVLASMGLVGGVAAVVGGVLVALPHRTPGELPERTDASFDERP